MWTLLHMLSLIYRWETATLQKVPLKIFTDSIPKTVVTYIDLIPHRITRNDIQETIIRAVKAAQEKNQYYAIVFSCLIVAMKVHSIQILNNDPRILESKFIRFLESFHLAMAFFRTSGTFIVVSGTKCLSNWSWSLDYWITWCFNDMKILQSLNQDPSNRGKSKGTCIVCKNRGNFDRWWGIFGGKKLGPTRMIMYETFIKIVKMHFLNICWRGVQLS